MPRLTPITKREQVSGDALTAFDAIIESSTTVALLMPIVIVVVGSDIVGPESDDVVATETRTEQVQQGDSPSIPAG